jgi:hypothetical protein
MYPQQSVRGATVVVVVGAGVVGSADVVELASEGIRSFLMQDSHALEVLVSGQYPSFWYPGDKELLALIPPHASSELQYVNASPALRTHAVVSSVFGQLPNGES